MKYLCFLIFIVQPVFGNCPGKFVNPITDICWSCIFPITVGPIKVNIGGREDTPNPSSPICLCPKPPIPVLPGISIGFWEPVRLVDVTRKPFCMVGLGGLSLQDSVKNHGCHTGSHDYRRGSKKSFYQVHWYIYPLIYWLELLTDFLCIEQASFDVGYITEFDPFWNDDETSFVLNPESVLFGNIIAQAACSADCLAATAKFPLDEMFWCGGCQGSIYPFTGTVPNHVGGVQASLLLVERFTAKLHRELLAWRTSGKDTKVLCNKQPAPFIKKSQYKIQMTYPIPGTRGNNACIPMGRSEVIFGSGREFPMKGEDFGYLIWRKRNCCLL
jgi:conjugal transfer pilus assembly protein TraU